MSMCCLFYLEICESITVWILIPKDKLTLRVGYEWNDFLCFEYFPEEIFFLLNVMYFCATFEMCERYKSIRVWKEWFC